jgi:hypothetical protein
MIIRSKTDPGVVGIVELNEEEKLRAIYIGHYTIDALIDFLELLKKSTSHGMVSIQALYKEEDKPGFFVLLAAPDGKEEYTAIAGCAHGRFGMDD